MAARIHATYLRRRDDRLRREEDQREHRRLERAMHEAYRRHVLGIHQSLVLDQAARDAVALGQTQPH